MTTPLIRQSWVMSAVLINMFGQGLVLSFPSSLLPALKDPDSPIKIDLHTASWLGSIVGVAGIPGFLISSFLMNLYGRKLTHGLMILPGVIGWILIYFATDVKTLMIGRFLGGFSSTATVSLGAIVIGEYTSPKYRGVFLYLKNVSVCVAAMFTHVVCRFIHWRTLSLINLIPLVIAIFIISTWPESPAWLLSKQNYDKSEEAFYWLRGRSDASKREITETMRTQQERMLNRLAYREKIFIYFRKFSQKDFLKPLIIMMLATMVLEMSGKHVFPAYAFHILTEMTGETSYSFYYTLGIDLTICTSAIFASLLVVLIKRRTLLFSTGFVAFSILMIVSTYKFLEAKQIILSYQPIIPVSFLLLYFIFANLGCAPIPLALIGEVFPLADRELGSALSGLWFSLCLLFGLHSTPHLIAYINIHGFFAVYGIIMGTCLLILFFIMPETKDRTLQEIENYFKFGSFTNKDIEEEEANSKMIP